MNALDWLFPPKCVLCSGLLPRGQRDVCPKCRLEEMVLERLPWKLPHLKSWVTLWNYRGKVRQAVVRYKFRHRRSYGQPFGRELAAKIRQSELEFDMITWVPISARRKLERSYDQVELIARSVSEELGIPAVRTLRKHRHNQRQSTLRGADARQANVKGVYSPFRPEVYRGKRVLLIDDVITTGATLSEAARTLKEAGARQVLGACLCVVPHW